MNDIKTLKERLKGYDWYYQFKVNNFNRKRKEIELKNLISKCMKIDPDITKKTVKEFYFIQTSDLAKKSNKAMYSFLLQYI